jgi:N-acetylated-alpha-linked acidic dipeptidase
MRRVFLAALLLASASIVQPYDGARIRGFTPTSGAAERELEQRFQAIPQPSNIRGYMQDISAEPHHAGSTGSRRVAEYIAAKFKSWGLDASIEEFEALMPYPAERSLELIEPERYTAKLQEPAVDVDPDSTDAGQLPTFNAYSADGDVTGELVYVNFGVPEDYEQLAKMGVDVKGRIVIARYGKSWRGIKPKVAAEHGAVACIIYSDPKDDGFKKGKVYPEGPFRPPQGVQRGSVMDMPVHPGDPLSPGWASEPGARKLARTEARTLLTIPVLPISYGDAEPLLKNLDGAKVPSAWRGGLPIAYRTGPGPAKVRVKLTFDWQIRPLYDVIVRIEGAEFPDEWILHGNHHDAWVNGASDPTSGNSALMETARGLSELLKTGWRPKRTIVLASWDGEEWGLLGSTEWVEKHNEELARKAVVYINSDSTGRGWLAVEGSHTLQAFINEVGRDVPDPRGTKQSVIDAKRAHELKQAKTAEARAKLQRGDVAIGALGSGSDYTAFLDHLAIASLNLSFGGDGEGGVYHSIYDSFYWFTHFSDTEFAHTAALSRVIGTAILRLANSDVLPFEFGGLARTLSEYSDELEKLQKGATERVDLSPVRAAVDGLQKAADEYEAALRGLQDRPSNTADLNRTLYSTERAFRYEPGLPSRDWFKHVAYAPGLYTGYGVKTLPGIREAIEQKRWDEARTFVPIVAAAIDRVAADVRKAAGLLH